MASIVDMHAHYMSPQLLHEAEHNGAHYGVRLERNAEGNARLSFNGGPLLRPFFHKLCDLAHRLPDMDAAGIGLQVVSTWTDVAGDDLPPVEGARWARLQNETMAADIRAYPGRFAAMGTLPMQDVGLAIEELNYIVDHLGMRSVEIGTSINGRDLDHPDFRPLWQRLHARNIFVFLHPPLRPVGLDRTGDYFLNNLISYPTDTTIAAARLIFSGILDDLPGLKICLAHSGGFMPFEIGRFDLGFAMHPACSKTLKHPPSDLLTTFVYDSLTHNSKVLSFLIDMVGADSVVYGTDYPFEMLEAMGPARVETLPGLSRAARDDILGNNVRALLGDTPRRIANEKHTVDA
ncbi:aminocarboxymuconate-semialdehyde decarboxylase [Nitrobacteraceae bacterium AZCC 2161]